MIYDDNDNDNDITICFFYFFFLLKKYFLCCKPKSIRAFNPYDHISKQTAGVLVLKQISSRLEITGACIVERQMKAGEQYLDH